MKVKETARVLSQTKLAEGVYSMVLSTRASESALPGQFINIFCNNKGNLLPRPISICEIDKAAGTLRVVFRVVGEGTKEFSSLKAEDTVEILGPLGNGFPLETGTAIVVGGGIGVPPMLELTKQLSGEVTAVMGYRNDDLFLADEFIDAANELIVATDDERIYNTVKNFGGVAEMTSVKHKCGSDRIMEVVSRHPEISYICNLQGDEPLIEPALIDELVAEFLADENLQMATVATELIDEGEMKNPNNVKVIFDKNNNALYFSRSLIPYPRNVGISKVYKHIGIYAYRRNFLLNYAKMESTPLEQTESLEQLRALENGYKIRTVYIYLPDKRACGRDNYKISRR